MASMTRQNLRDYVRVFLDTDDIELPDVLVDVFYDEAVSRVERASQHWRFYESEWTLSVVASTQTYAFTDIGTSTTRPADIVVVEGPRIALIPESHERARAAYVGTTSTGTPYAFSQYADTLYLWPSPTTSEDYTLRGYRQPVDSTDAGTGPDLPVEFHPVVGLYMLASCYLQQDDDIMGSVFEQRAENKLRELRKRYEAPPEVGIVTIGGHKDYQGYNLPMDRLRYPFE